MRWKKTLGVALKSLKVDGGMVHNDLLMQFQADILGVPVVRPKVAETTALGAAYAAGLAVGFWDNLDDLRANWQDRQNLATENGYNTIDSNFLPIGKKLSSEPSIG